MGGLDLDGLTVATIIVIAFGASIIGGLSGFSAGALIAPFLLPVFGEKSVFPVVAMAMTVGNLSRLWVYRRSIDLPSIRTILPAVVPGVVLGIAIYDMLPPRALSVLIGILLIASIFIRRFMAARAIRSGPVQTAGIAFGAGVISGNAPGGGIVIVSLLLGYGLKGATLVGTDAAIGSVVSIVNAVLFGSLGHLPMPALLTGLAVGAAMIPGAYAARWIMTHLPVSIHLLAMEAIIAASGIVFIWNGLISSH
jgi:uncharacterized membrane protein YfcA